ncbi:hypothetical protein PC129_g13603 [Phytophthora cactorum]|uniref:Uncharacterized protein n=1 Tax=Phytophthora cactorum TaxID=29920 RepID=A0A8T1HRT0_9STRA|nr:hypothetical protein PC129_g13603 [Phytophthora cactorum]
MSSDHPVVLIAVNPSGSSGHQKVGAAALPSEPELPPVETPVLPTVLLLVLPTVVLSVLSFVVLPVLPSETLPKRAASRSGHAEIIRAAVRSTNG